MNGETIVIYDILHYSVFSEKKALEKEVQESSKQKYLLDDQQKMVTLTKLCKGNYESKDLYVIMAYHIYTEQLLEETLYNYFAGRYFTIKPDVTNVKFCEYKVCIGERLNKIALNPKYSNC